MKRAAEGLNLLDKLIAWLSPKWGARRLWDRVRLKAARAFYDGATIGRRGASIRRLVADPNVTTMRNLPKLREGSRDLMRNNPHARRAKEAIVSEMIGIGIRPQFLRDGKRAQDIERLAAAFLETTACDAYGRHTYQGLESVAADAIVESGEAIIRRRWRRASDSLAVPMQYQILEPDYIDSAKDGPSDSGGWIVQGVEFDAIGRRRWYWLHDTHPGSNHHTGISHRVPARDVAHIYRCDRPEQVRGVPWIASVMLRLADFADYEDAQLMRQKIAACFAGFIKETYPDNVVAPNVKQNEEGQFVDSIEPGMIERLPPGTEIVFGEPPPATEYEAYVRTSLRSIAAGVGISYEALTGDLRGVNFSSGKMGRLAMERNVDRWRKHMFIPQFCDVLTGWFLEALEFVGANVEGVKVQHIAPRREMIDPPREYRAERDAIRSGLKTLSTAILERGRDPVEHLEELAADMKRLQELGLTLDIDVARVSQAGTTQPGAGREDEEEDLQELVDSMRNGHQG